MIQIAICDDELSIAKSIAQITSKHAKQLNIPVAISVYQNSIKFLEEYYSGKFDVAFIDIDMPELNGDALSAELIKIDSSILIVYVTNCCNDEVYTMLKYMPIGFIRKTVFEEEIDSTLIAIQSKIQSIQKIYTLQSGKQIIKICLKDVMYIESIKNYAYFKFAPNSFYNNSEIKAREKLDELQKNIENYGFIRIHTSILVNYQYIFQINKNEIILMNGEKLPISRSHEKETVDKFLFFSRR